MSDNFRECRDDESETTKLYWNNKSYSFAAALATHSRYERHFYRQDGFWDSTLSIDGKQIADPSVRDAEHHALTRQILAIVERGEHDFHDITYHLLAEKSRRHYWNNRGVEYLAETLSFSVFMQYVHSGGTETFSDGGSSIGEIEQLLRAGVSSLRERALWPGKPQNEEPLPQKVHLILSPDVSAVLIHELIGHGSEEVSEEAVLPLSVGPDFLQVSVIYPTTSGYDDEGVPSSELTLLQDGKLITRVVDRERVNTLTGWEPSGLAQVSAHGGKPRVRCTYLRATGGSGEPAELIANVDKGILCLATSGGEFHAGTALVSVSAARYIKNGRLGDRAPQFFFLIRLNDFRHRLITMANDTSVGRTGTCLKEGDEVRTCTSAPTMLLSDISIWRKPDGMGNPGM